jgi:predicted amidohydrolase
MRVAAVQFAPQFGLPDYNLERALDLAAGTRAKLYVMPELLTTGYQFLDRDEARRLAEPVPDGRAVERLEDFTRGSSSWVIAGLAEAAGDQVFNSAVLVGPQGFVGVYRKTHLFWNETKTFDPGNTGFRVFDVEGVKVGIMICYDWIFPESARTLALLGADVIASPSNLVLPWAQRGMIVRSIENRVYTVLANRYGRESRGSQGELVFTGGSQITAPDGSVLGSGPAEMDAVVVADVDPDAARNKAITPLNHALDDRRPDYYLWGDEEEEDGA